MSRKISAAEWQQHEDTIKYLYISKDMTLEKVKTEMERLGFYASKSQYTSQLSKWGCSKNTTSTVYKIVGHKLKRKGIDLEDAAVCINEQLVPTKKLKKEVNRYYEPLWEISLGGISPRTPEGVTININSVPDYRLLWSPSLPFFNLLQIIRECNWGPPGPVHGRVRDNETLDPLNSFSSQPELSMPRPADIVGPAALSDGRDQVPLKHVSGHVSPSWSGPGSQITETCADSSVTADSRAVVAECFGLPLASNPVQQEHEVFSYLEPLIIDMSPGETAKAVRTLLGQPSRTKTSILMAYVAYLASNSLIDQWDVDNFVDFFLREKHPKVFHWILAEILDSGTMTAQAFAARLLHGAVRRDACDVVKLILDHGIEIDRLSNGPQSQTPLQCALRSGAIATATFLIEHGTDTNSNGLSHHDEQSVSDSDSEDGYDTESTDNMDLVKYVDNDDLPIVIAARNRESWRTIPMLIEHGANLPQVPIIRHVISSSATYAPRDDSRIEVVKYLINAGACVNSIYPTLWEYPTAIQEAVFWRDTAMTRLLLEHGADPGGPLTPSNFSFLRRYVDPTMLGHSYLSPLALAAKARGEDGIELLNLLLGAGADVNASPADILGAKDIETEQSEDTRWFFEPVVFGALQVAADACDVVKAKVLLERGARVETLHGTPPLAIAAGHGDAAMVRLLLQHGADVNAHSRQGLTALVAAAAEGRVEILTMLLQSRARVDHCPTRRIAFRSALQAAAEEGHTEAINILLNAGANVNDCCASRGGISALQGAIRSRRFDNVRLLLGYGAHVNSCCIAEKDGTTTLHAAIETGDVDWIQFFLNLGARVNMCLKHLDLPSSLEQAVKSCSEDIVKLVVEAGADVNSPVTSARRDTALQLAVGRRHHGIVQILLDAGADVNAAAPSSHGHTALGWAIDCGDLTAVSMLIQRGADLTMATNPRGLSPLYAACTVSKPNEEILRLLLNAGADVDLGGHERHDSALVALIDKGRTDLADLLIMHGADINFRASSEARTPLQVASEIGNVDLVRKLVDSGADVNSAAPTRAHGRTALQAAVERGCIQIVSFLLSRDADVNAPAGPIRGVTALQAAAIKGALRLAQLLLTQGADVGASASPKHGRTAIDGAAEHGRLDMLNYLLDNYNGDQTKMQLCENASKYARKNKQWDVIKLLKTYSESDGSIW